MQQLEIKSANSETKLAKDNIMTQSTNTTTQTTSTNKVNNMNKLNINFNTENMVITKTSSSSLADAINTTKERAARWYSTSIKELYDILGDCYEIYASVENAENKAARDYLRAEVEELFKLINASESATTTQTRIISIVFNLPDIDRRTRSRYARVIKKAFDADNKPSNASGFVEWLTCVGGINKALEQNNNDPQPSVSEMAQKVEQCSKVQATFPLATKGNRFVVMLANPVDKENVELLWHSDNEALTNKIVAMVYKELNKDEKENKVQNSTSVADEIKTETAQTAEA